MYFSELYAGRESSNRIETLEEPSVKVTKNVKEKKHFLSSAWNYIWLFLNSSSIHGFQHLTAPRRHWLEYALWLGTVILALRGTTYISYMSWNRYWNDPTVIAIERNYRVWNTTLPSVTICPNVQLWNLTLLREKFRREFPKDEAEEKLEFLEALASVHYDTLDVTVLKPNLTSSYDPEEYMSLLYENRHVFEYSGSIKDSGFYEECLTEMGICEMFNSKLAIHMISRHFFNPKPTKPVSEPAMILMNGTAISGDVVSMILGINCEYTARFSSTNDVPDTSTPGWHSPMYSYYMFQFICQMTTCQPDVKSLQVSQRKCRFMDESNLEISHVYSYNLCRMNCRHRLSVKLCQCSPHWYKKVPGIKICDWKGLQCLHEYKDLLQLLRDPETNVKVECSCLPTCEDEQCAYDVVDKIFWFLGQNFKYAITKLPRLQVRREVIFTFSDLLVSVGGAAGLFLGCSVLSFVEVIHFFTLRLMWNILKRRRRLVKPLESQVVFATNSELIN